MMQVDFARAAVTLDSYRGGHHNARELYRSRDQSLVSSVKRRERGIAIAANAGRVRELINACMYFASGSRFAIKRDPYYLTGRIYEGP